jgi:hypothetical protein
MSQDMEVGVSSSHVSGGHVRPYKSRTKKHARSDKVFECAYKANTCSRYQAREEHQQLHSSKTDQQRPTTIACTSNTATDHDNSVASDLSHPLKVLTPLLHRTWPVAGRRSGKWLIVA